MATFIVCQKLIYKKLRIVPLTDDSELLNLQYLLERIKLNWVDYTTYFRKWCSCRSTDRKHDRFSRTVLITFFNPLTPNDLQRRRVLKIKILSKNMLEKPTNTLIIHSVY
jgi:hypothetical protein